MGGQPVGATNRTTLTLASGKKTALAISTAPLNDEDSSYFDSSDSSADHACPRQCRGIRFNV